MFQRILSATGESWAWFWNHWGVTRGFKEEVTGSDVFPEGMCGHTGWLVSDTVEGIVEAVKLGRRENTAKVKMGHQYSMSS